MDRQGERESGKGDTDHGDGLIDREEADGILDGTTAPPLIPVAGSTSSGDVATATSIPTTARSARLQTAPPLKPLTA